MSDQTCPSCGASVGADFVFCVHCGVPLAEEESGAEGFPTMTNLPRQEQLARHESTATAPEPPLKPAIPTQVDTGFPLFRDEPWSARTPTEQPNLRRIPASPAMVPAPVIQRPEVFVPTPPPPPAEVEHQPSGRGTLAVIGAISLAIILGMVYLGWSWLNGGDPPNSPQPAPIATTPATEDTPLAKPSPIVRESPEAGSFSLPADATACDSLFVTDPASKFQKSAVGNKSTTCPFAEAVRQAYLLAGGDGQALDITAYSPSTKQSYSMTCQGGEQVYCKGGTNALVILYR